MEKICVVGGGNLGHFIVARLGKDNIVNVYTRRPQLWQNEVEALDIFGKVYKGKVKLATDNASEALRDVSLVFITWPTNILAEKISEIEPYLKEGVIVCFCPGYGGKEFICKKLIDKGCILCGSQRVFSSTKVLEYGKTVQCIDNRPAIYLGTIFKEHQSKCKELMERLFEKKCVCYENYLNITLTPSNPVLHTSRLYSLFGKSEPEKAYDEHLNFYCNWTDYASEILINADAEVQNMCKYLKNMNLDGVRSLKDHYELFKAEGCSSDVERMTTRLKELKFLKDYAPMKCVEGKYYVDYESRYFQEDFVFGLAIVQDFLRVLKLDSPQIDEIMEWFFTLPCGGDIEHSRNVLPHMRGIGSEEDIYEFYCR